MGVPDHLIWLFQNLYENNEAIVKFDNKLFEPFKTQREVRQGCVLSSRLFNTYSEYIMRWTLEAFQDGISIGGKKLNNLRFADDTTLLVKDESELTEVLLRITEESRALGLEINLDKTKLMIIDKGNVLQLGNQWPQIEVVQEFVYLGSLITNRGDTEEEIRRRIVIARTTMTSLTKICRNRQITMNTKKTLIHTLVFSIFMYDVESWTIK